MKFLLHYAISFRRFDARQLGRSAALAILLAVNLSLVANAQVPTQVFGSGFEPNTALGAPTQCFGTGCWQYVVGTDVTTGGNWETTNVWGGSTAAIFLLADAPVDATTVRDYMFSQILSVTGHVLPPATSRVLYSEITKSGCCGGDPQGGGASQTSLQIQPATEPSGTAGDLYISYWLKFQPGLGEIMGVPAGYGNGQWHWRSFFEWKTAGDYRVLAQVKRDPWINNGELYWSVIGDNEANGGLPYQLFWEETKTTVAVPIGKWFKYEVFWHRSGDANGRVWMAVDGQPIVDRFGSNMGTGLQNSPAPINRIFVNNLYSSTSYPIYQWMDDLKIWNGFPSVCPDLPCAPH